MTVRRWFRLSLGRWALPVCGVVIALHLGLRSTDWSHEWLRTVLIVTFSSVFLGPLASGIGAVEGGRWGRAEFPRALDRPRSGTAVRAWAALAVWMLLPIPIALLSVGLVLAATSRAGLPSAGDLIPLLGTEAVMVGWATVGFAFGWRTRSQVVTAPLVAGLAFALTLTLWGSTSMVVDTGGTYDSLIGLRVNPWVGRAQLLFWIGITLGVVASLASRHRVLRATPVMALAAALAVGGVMVGGRANGMTFVSARAHVHCAPVLNHVPLCLAPGYEPRRTAMTSVLGEAFTPWERAGLPLPTLITQDVSRFGETTMWLSGSEVLHPRVGALQHRLVQSLVPAGCDYWNRPTVNASLDLVTGTMVTHPIPGEVVPPGATGEKSRQVLREAVATIRACAPETPTTGRP